MNRQITFGSWLESQLVRREMSQSDLARKLETSTSTVSNWVNGQRIPSPESCDKLADVFGVSVDEVLGVAGHRPRGLDEWDPDIKEVAGLMQRMPESFRAEIVEFAQWRYERSRSKVHA